MLERYLLSTLASKFGHVFEDFDENTTAELSAWRGVLALRNLHLRKDALKHLGVPLADDGGEGEEDDDTDCFSEDGNDEMETHDDVGSEDNGGASDDDSFRSCASQIDDVSQSSSELHGRQSDTSAKERPPTHVSMQPHTNAPTIEVVHGYIGSLELHIPWRLLRATRAAASSASENNDTEETSGGSKSQEEEDTLKCSAVLSDVRILLAPNNHTRNQTQSRNFSSNQRKKGDVEESSSMRKKRKLQELERIQRERELAVQSLLERELFRIIQGSNEGVDNVSADSPGKEVQIPESNDESWLSRWAKGLVARILSSLQVTIKNIHIRYEDEGCGWFEDTTPQRRQYRPAFAVGMRLASFSIRSPSADDKDDNKASISAAMRLRHKIANVEKLSVYWDSSHSDLFVGYATSEDDRDYYDSRFSELDIMSADDFEGGTLQHSYLIQPISPSLQLVMVAPDVDVNATTSGQDLINNDLSADTPASESPPATPSIHATLCLPSCHIGFDRNTLEDIAYVRKCFSAYKAHVISSKEQVIEHRISRQLLDLRPPSDIRPKDNPGLWWNYVIEAVRVLQSDRSYFEGKAGARERKWKRDGWLGLSLLLRLRNEYSALYKALWISPQDDIESRTKIHRELMALEDLLNCEEIAAFRIAVYTKLKLDPQNRTKDSFNVDELVRGNLSVLSIEYRETKLNQIVRSIHSDRVESDVHEHDDEKQNALYMEPILTAKTPTWVVSVACQDFTIQANDSSSASNAPHNITTHAEIPQVVPIVRLQCLSSLRFEKHGNGSWDLSCALSSLTVFDLMSPFIDDCEGHTLIGSKPPKSGENTNKVHSNDTAKIIIRNVVSDDDTQNQATTFFQVDVSPLEIYYSTNAFEALSRVFAAVKTIEFNRDYGRISQALSRWRLRQGKRLMAVLARRKKFVVSINIAAPVLFIPEDLQNTTSPSLVVDLGRLTFQSDSSEAPPLGFDDKWLLQIDSIRVLCIHHSSIPIIEPFSLKFSILSHIAEGSSSNTDITKIEIQALLPQLSFNFTTSAVRLVSRLQIRWNDAKLKNLRNPEIPQRQTLDEFLLANSGPSPCQTSHAGLFSKGEAVSKVDIHSNATELNFSFSAPTIALQIGNDVGFDQSTAVVPASNIIPLLNLSIRGIRGNLISKNSQSRSSSQFSARLRSIHATDIQKSGNNLCHFLSSVDPDLLQDCDYDGEKDLVAVEMSKNPNGDKKLSINFHELYVEWNPELLARVQKSLRTPLSQVSKTAPASSVVNVINQTSNEAEFFDAVDSYKSNESNGAVPNATKTASSQTMIQNSPPHFEIMFHLSKFRVNFNKDSQCRCLFTTEMNQTDITFRLKPRGGSITTLTVENMRLKDPDGIDGGNIYGQMIGLQQPGGFGLSSAKTSSIVHMSFESFTNQNGNEPEFHNLMKIEFSEMKFVYIHQLWLEIFDYFFEGILGHAVLGTKPKPSPHFFNPSEATRAFKRTKMSIKMDSPLILLPVCCRSPQHIRLEMNALTVASHFTREQMNKKEGKLTKWIQYFHNAKLSLCGLDVQSWDERKLSRASGDGPPTLTLNIRWPVGPTAPLLKPKWNVNGTVDPIVFRLSRKDFSLFRFFASYNLLAPSRFLSHHTSPGDAKPKVTKERLVLFGYEKTGTPPTTYSLELSSDSLAFEFLLDEEESESRKIEEVMNVNCSNASYKLIKGADCISKQSVNVDSICLKQTSNREEWSGFPELLLPLPTSIDKSMPQRHCLFQFTSTTHPNGNNVKTLHLNQAGIYLIVPAWQHVGDFFRHLPTAPVVFEPEEMSSIMQVGDRFYRMSKSNYQAKKSSTDGIPVAAESSKQFLFTFTSPQIIMVADSTNQEKDCPCVTLSMAKLHFLRQTNINATPGNEAHSLYVDGLEILTGPAKKSSPRSSLLCPLSISMRSKRSSQHLSGWVWTEELQARATYTDLTHAIEVFKGVKEQITASSRPAQQSTKSSSPDEANEGRRAASQVTINIDALCDGFNLVVTDDSQRQFANSQPLVAVSLTGIRVSHIAADTSENKMSQALPLTEDLPLEKNTFVSLDGLELTDLLQHQDSSFGVMATSSHAEHNLSKRGIFSFTSHIELDSMSWDTHRMTASDWGFQTSPSMERRENAICQLDSPTSYFDKSQGQLGHFVAFHSVLHGNGLHSIDVDFQDLTAQWNPSTIIALQRFLGRLKKAALTMLGTEKSITDANGPTISDSLPSKEPVKSCHIIFTLKANIGSVCICLNKEYQQRRLLDGLVTGFKIQFERYKDQSLLLQGSIEKLRAWDPDMSRTTSDRNRHLLRLTEDVPKSSSSSISSSHPFFSFQYRTFRTFNNRQDDKFFIPDWVENKIASGEIDDFLAVKMRPLEFNHLSERTSELADYLNNGLPGKGMGATSKAAKSFCASRIRTRSFLDLVIDQPHVFIPRSPSSIVGGCHLSLGTVSVTSWFEEAYARPNVNRSNSVDVHSLVGVHSLSLSGDEMDWWRVLNIKLGIGIKIEVNQSITGVMSNPDTFFHTNLTMRKPSSGQTTIIQGNVPSFRIHLKYREFMMLNLIVLENIGKAIDENKWDNIEKTYWQQYDDDTLPDDPDPSSMIYAESARFVRFGEAKVATSKENHINFAFLVESISVTLHRDDWFENLDKENAALLCYDICNFSVHKMDVSIATRSNEEKTISIALSDMSFMDVGDYGRLARDIYLGSPIRLPCAFSVVAEGYGKSSKADPLVSLVIGTQTSYPDGIVDKDTRQGRKKVAKNVELKVNSLSVTLLPRSIDDVICFLSKTWNCPNSNLEIQSAKCEIDTQRHELDRNNSSKKHAEVESLSTATLMFKFTAIYPRLILLADESDPFSRALVLRGLAVGNMNIIREEASSVSIYEQIDARVTTSIEMHVKELETYIHNNIDMIVNQTESQDNVALIEPVTVAIEARIESRSRFPTSRFVSIEIEPVAVLLSFSDLNLIETVLGKSTRKKKAKPPNETNQFKSKRRAQSNKTTAQFDSVQFSKSSDYSECNEAPPTFDVVILTEKLGLQLRKSGSSVIVENSLNNIKVEAGDILLSINFTPLERMPLSAIVEMFESTPRPLTITLSRKHPSSADRTLQYQSGVNVSNATTSNSLSYDTSSNSDTADTDAENIEASKPNKFGNLSQVFHFDLSCAYGMPNGLEFAVGLGDAAVLDKIDYEVFARCAQSSTNALDLDNISGMIASKRLPLPGAILLAVDGKEIDGKEIALEKMASNEKSTEKDRSYTLSFVEADSAVWGTVSNFEGKLNFSVTVIDDTNGRDMPVIRAGLKKTSFVANHGLAIATKAINARKPSLLSFNDEHKDIGSPTFTMESEVSSFNLEYNNAIINQWEPIIEPHCLVATIERQSGSGLHPGQCSIVISDRNGNDCSNPGPIDFICVNLSDSAADILSKAAVNWKQWRSIESQTQGENLPATPKQATSPVFGPTSSASAADLRKATKLAKLALDFSRKRGKTAHTETSKRAPFIFRNRSGLRINFSARGIATTVIKHGSDTQFQLNTVNDIERFRKYDGQFPTVDIELGFDILGRICTMPDQTVFADPITDLPTDKVGCTVRSVRLWNRKQNRLISKQISVVWIVELEENRRVLTLSSATDVKVYGCGHDVEVGVRFLNKDDDNIMSDEITTIGTTAQGNKFHLPIWVESCFCAADVFIRPSTESLDTGQETGIYNWSTFPVLSLREDCWAADVTEVHYNWVTEIALTLGGVSCPVNASDDRNAHPTLWLPLTYSKDLLRDNSYDDNTGSQYEYLQNNTVTIWPALTIRNMLPCNIEWEVASDALQGLGSIFDSSFRRTERHGRNKVPSFSSAESESSDHCSALQCGAAVEVFSPDILDKAIDVRFRIDKHGEQYRSDWLQIGLLDATMKKSLGEHTNGAKQINIQCRNSSGDDPLSIGVKISSREKGVNLTLYAKLWLRNLTALPLTFGAPSLQVCSNECIDSSLQGKVTADSALVELTSVFEGKSFGLFGNDDDGEDPGNDIVNLPLQQCDDDIFEEVFEYVSLDGKGKAGRRWWASENHVSLRQEPSDDTAVHWLVDCAGEPFLQNGWESCANIAGSKSFTFNGRRLFDKSHRFRRRRWFHKTKKKDRMNGMNASISDRVIFHQPADVDQFTRSKREAERNAVGVDTNGSKGVNSPDFHSPPQHEGVLDIMTRVADDESILVHVKHKDSKWSTPAIIPSNGSSNGVIRACSSRWPLVTKAIKDQQQKGVRATWDSSDGNCPLLGAAPLEPSVYELIYQVTVLSGLWGELSRMVTIMPRFLVRNESSWLGIDLKQVGAPDSSRIAIQRGETLPFYWFDVTLPELVCVRPSQSRNRCKWTGGFDLCTLGMLPLRVRRVDGSIDNLNIRSMRVNVELQPGTGGFGMTVSIRDEDPCGEGSLFRIENHCPFQVFVTQDGILANPASILLRSDTSSSCDMIQPGECTSYALDVPWRQGKYAGRTSASMSELLLLRCALAPLSSIDGVESTKVVCFARVGDYIRLSPSKLSSSISSSIATELLGVRILGIVGTDGPTRTLRFILMQKEVTHSSYIGNAMRETINPMPSFMSAETKNDNADYDSRTNALLDAARNASQLLNAGSLPNEREAAKQAFFGTGICKRSPLERSDKLHPHTQTDCEGSGDNYSCELSCSGFIFSIIDSSVTELAVLSFHEVRAGASWDSLGMEYSRSRVEMGWFQLDNHCPNVYPVAIRPSLKSEGTRESNVDAEHAKKAFTADKPFLEIDLALAPSHRTGIQSLTVGASLHDVEVFVDLSFILRIQRFLLGIQDHLMVATGIRERGFVDSRDTWDLPYIEQLIKQKTGRTSSHQSVFNFQRLTILPCKVKLSVAPTRALTKHQEEFEGNEASAIHAAVRKGDLLVSEGQGVLGVKIGSKNRTAMSVVQGIFRSILVDALVRVDGASLNFEGVALFNHTANSPQLMTYLGAHYLSSLIANVPSLIGSLAAFGNPLGLIRDLGDGVSDFVNEPVRGFKKSIQEMDPSFVMHGVRRGTGSLARHTVGGFADSAAMLTETAAKNMAVFTLDRKYAQRRDRIMESEANDANSATILKGLESGMQKLAQGIMEGVTGVISKPIQGAERSGFEGFAKGVGKGLLGLVMKPVIGTTDLLTDTLIGVKGSIAGTVSEDGMLTLYSQVRPRRALYGRDRVIKPYKIDDATAATIQSTRSIGGEEYLSHVDMIKNVALMSVKKLLILSGDGEERLLLSLNEIRNVEVQPQIGAGGFVVRIFYLKPKVNGSELEEVECDDEGTAHLLCEKLTEAVGQWSQG